VLEQRAGEMLAGAVAARGIGDRRLRRLRKLDQLGQRGGLHRGMDQHELREGGHQADRGEVRGPVVGQALVDQRIDGVAHRHHRERGAVAGGLGDDLARHHAVGAGPVTRW
jgi:hypothetical protein